MDHCRLDFYCVSCHPEVFEPIRTMPALAPFSHTFTVSGQFDPAAVAAAAVILADLRDMDGPGMLQILLSRKTESAQLILLADQEQFGPIADQLTQVTDLWIMPMTEDELRFRFLRWQQARRLSHERDALSRELDKARMAQKAKSAFLSSISHDIRTPVNAVMGIVTLLRGDAENREKVLEYTQQIEAASHHLLSLINDVLDMNRLENGVATLNVGELCLADIIDEINAIIRPQAKAREQTFAIRADSLTHEHLSGDKLRISQILINILSNAVKYTQKGGLISMTVTELPQPAPDRSRIRFAVTDNGQGMSEDYQKVIFDPFSREQDAPANQIRGSGLGMAITKSLVELMNGTIQVESQPGKGSTFTVELELHIEEKEEDSRFWENHGIRRMIVADDDEYACQAVLKSMSGTGVEVEYATRGAAAAQMIRQAWEKGAPYDLLLLDWKMPELDGLETARLIRSQKDSGKLPILLFTAYDWTDIEKEALEAGISHFLPKPFFMSSFRDTIRRVMANRGKPHRGEPQTAPPPSSPNPRDVLRGKHVLVVDDIDVNRMILVKILSALGAECDTAVNGQIAVDKFLSSAPGEIDLIMMDIQMPVMDGYTATRTIRASNHPSAQSIPVVAITANALVEDVREAMKAGMDAHIAKPVVVDKMIASLRDVFAQREK